MGDSEELTKRTPLRPEHVRVQTADRAALVSWDQPSSGVVVTRYEVTPFVDAAPQPERAIRVDGSAKSGFVRELVNGTTYTVRVTPWSDYVAGPSAVSPIFEPNAAPSAPHTVLAVSGEQSATVSWLPPAEGSGGPLERYRVTASPRHHGYPVEVPAGQLSALVGGLHNRARYTFTVEAVNSTGSGVSSPSNPVWPGDDLPGYLFPLAFFYLLALGALAYLYALQYPALIDVPWLGHLTIPALRDAMPPRVAGVPISIPWFGALGAVLAGLYGIFDHAHRDWDRYYNMSYVVRPFVGVALSVGMIIAFAGGLQLLGIDVRRQFNETSGPWFYEGFAFLIGAGDNVIRRLAQSAVDALGGFGRRRANSRLIEQPKGSVPATYSSAVEAVTALNVTSGYPSLSVALPAYVVISGALAVLAASVSLVALVAALIAILTLTCALVLAYVTVRAMRERVLVARRDHATDQFRWALSELSSDDVSRRIAGVQVLESLVANGWATPVKVATLLVGFLRQRAATGQIDQSIAGTREDVQAAVAALGGLGREYTSFEPVGLDLSHLNLSGCDFADADLRYADFREADLRDAQMMAVDLTRAILLGAQLNRANLMRCVLTGAFLERAQLSGAALVESNLQRANFQATDLTSARLDRADLRGTSLGGSDLTNANLSGADLRGAILYGANLQGAILAEAIVTSEDLDGADLRGALLPPHLMDELGDRVHGT